MRFYTAYLVDNLGCRRLVIISMCSNNEPRLCVKAYCVKKDTKPSSKGSYGGNTSFDIVYSYLQSVKGGFRVVPPSGKTNVPKQASSPDSHVTGGLKV